MKCAIEINLPCLALPCLALPCLALPCLALPCLALPCLALPCLEAISILSSLFYVCLLHITFLKLSVFFFYWFNKFLDSRATK